MSLFDAYPDSLKGKKTEEKTLGQIHNGPLKGFVVGTEDCPFDRAVLVTDERLQGDPKGKLIATVLQSNGGNAIYWHRTGYNALEVMVDAEVVAFQTWKAGRWKEYDVVERKP